MRRLAVIGALVVGIMLPAATAQASSITFQGYSGSTVLATAEFDIVGGDLQITLTNTSPFDVLVPSNVLTGFFFDFSAAGTLTPVSAELPVLSTVLFGSDGGGDVGGEWAYKSGLSGLPYGADEGISSTGLGLFGPGGNFVGPDLNNQTALNGLDYGITSAGDNPATGNQKVTGSVPLIDNSVVFTLSYSGGSLDGFNLSSFLDPREMSFQYGTSLTEPNVRVPEPSSLLLLTLAMGAVGTQRKRRKVS